VKRRLLASYLGVAVLVLVLLEVPLAVAYARAERQALTDKVERDAVALASLVEDSLERGAPVPARVRRIARDYGADTSARVVVTDDRGRRLVDSAPNGTTDFSSRPEIVSALTGQIATGTRSSRTLGTDLLYVAVPVASSGVVHGAVRISYPTSAVDARIHRYWTVLAIIAAVVLAVAATVAAVLARWVTRPLDRLERAADAVGSGDLATRAPAEGPPEVRRLAETFNSMASELDTLLRSQDAFVADASHQLRTPLAALRLRLENLEPDVTDPGKEDLSGALREVERLSALLDGLLTLARADRAHSAPSSISLGPLVEERTEAWSALAAESDVDLRLELEGDLTALATEGRVEQVLDNLLANAIDASPAGATITVSTLSANGWAELHISDEGPGLSEAERSRAFDRFWQAHEGRDGFGLGLAIVQRLTAADGGDVQLRAGSSGGLEAVVRLHRAERRG
jgi:signal transduction histidine kinase